MLMQEDMFWEEGWGLKSPCWRKIFHQISVKVYDQVVHLVDHFGMEFGTLRYAHCINYLEFGMAVY